MNRAEFIEKDFLFSNSGLINRFEKKLTLHTHRWGLAIIVLCIAWLPLVIITAIDGTLYSGTGLPFLKDLAIQGRLLIGIPMLILIKAVVYRRIPEVLQYISEVLINPVDRDRFVSVAIQKAIKRTDSTLSEIIFLLAVVGFALSPAEATSLFITDKESGTWLISVKEGKQAMSLASNWTQYISIPIFQFLLLRWIWRYIVWLTLLFRISNMNLNLKPTHPDGSGGVGVIFLAQRNFHLFFVVCGMVISSVMINLFMLKTVTFETLKLQILGYVILAVFLIFIPMLFFTRKLVKTKYQGQLELSRAGTNLSKKYEEEWIKPMGAEKRIADDTVDPSMQVDYSGVHILLQEMRIIPIRLNDIFIMVVSLFIPFIPIFFIQYSVVELLQKLMGLLV